MNKLYLVGTNIDDVYYYYHGCYQSFDRARQMCKTDKCFVGEVETNTPQPETLEGWDVTYPKA